MDRSVITQIFTVTAPVFLIVALGYFWAVWKQSLDTETLGNLAVKVSTPCLVFTTLTTLDINPVLLGQMALAAASAIAISAFVGAIVLRLAGLPYHTYLPSLMHPNSGNIGLPLVLMAFGDEGLALGIAYFVVISISQYTLGFGLAAGTFSLARLVKQPIIYAVLASIVVIALDVATLSWVTNTTRLLGGIVIPVLLMMLGYSLRSLTVGDLRLAMFLAVVRASMGLVIGVCLVILLQLEGPPAGVVFLMCMMPIAVFNFVFAEHFNRSPKKVAGAILVSTLMSFAILPVVVWIAIHIADGEPIFGVIL